MGPLVSEAPEGAPFVYGNHIQSAALSLRARLGDLGFPQRIADVLRQHFGCGMELV